MKTCKKFSILRLYCYYIFIHIIRKYLKWETQSKRKGMLIISEYIWYQRQTASSLTIYYRVFQMRPKSSSSSSNFSKEQKICAFRLQKMNEHWHFKQRKNIYCCMTWKIWVTILFIFTIYTASSVFVSVDKWKQN